ncbi:hypothetical protein DSC45_08490 [Streptomyces sp. YIM 130001]|uniref:hypothetical protein n=1 Tax=Streptomyces sp. YIM 130001 TaxID=2259644 RepID=UPI000EBA2793|nr:hypothetical protein [Streptomyces sp. YIM 130001]RII18648.1 hypothetical protein DSC45_08490 [Streptomyces sp. YIM 130001]
MSAHMTRLIHGIEQRVDRGDVVALVRRGKQNASRAAIPAWGADAAPQVLHEGPGRPLTPEERENAFDHCIGNLIAQGWTVLHRKPGAALIGRDTPVTGGGQLAGAATAGVGVMSMIGGFLLMAMGGLLTLTIIGAIIGIPMIMAGVAAVGGGAAAGAAGAAGGIAARAGTMTYRRQVWIDETGRIYVKWT